MTEGRILRIEKLSCYDGDGLRTVVFLKGCPLRCQWCSTPESHNLHSDFGNHKNSCTHCFTCVNVCPENAISYIEQGDVFLTDMNKCTDCRQCIDECIPGSRISYGYTASVEQVMKELEKDSLFYFHSGGGITISGGEPFVQTDFLCELLEKCIMLGMDTAIETSGYTRWENIEKALPFLDTVFFDIKHMDDPTHEAITGVNNSLILENLKKVDQSRRNFSLIVRIPVIPSINDSDSNLEAVGVFCEGLTKLQEIQLLPYHRLGLETYHRLSLPYQLEHLGSLDPAALAGKAAIFEEMGLRVVIGN